MNLLLCIHGHDTEGRCVDICKRADMDPQATLADVNAVLDVCVTALASTISVTDSWFETCSPDEPLVSVRTGEAP